MKSAKLLVSLLVILVVVVEKARGVDIDEMVGPEMHAELTQEYLHLLNARNNWLFNFKWPIDVISSLRLPSDDTHWTRFRVAADMHILKKDQTFLCDKLEELEKKLTSLIKKYDKESSLHRDFFHICCKPDNSRLTQCDRKETTFDQFWNVFRVRNLNLTHNLTVDPAN